MAVNHRMGRILTLEEYFNRKATLFMDRDLHAIAASYRFPSAVYHGSRLNLIQGPDDALEWLQFVVMQVDWRRTELVRPLISWQKRINERRISAEVLWQQFDASEIQIGETRMIYFLVRDKEHGFLIELVEVPDMASDVPMELLRKTDRMH